MKNNEDPRLLAHMKRVQAERRATAVGKVRIKQHNARLAMSRVAASSQSTITYTQEK